MTILEFAVAMDAELRANAHKGGWHNMAPLELLNRLKQETKELEKAIKEKAQRRYVLSEAADVANFAMMIANVYRQEAL